MSTDIVYTLNNMYLFKISLGGFLLNNQIERIEVNTNMIEFAANETTTLGTIKTNKYLKMFLILIVI